jgi:mRNA-degrading endonuclease toxin of MazEF toxin-antitoxin module
LDEVPYLLGEIIWVDFPKLQDRTIMGRHPAILVGYSQKPPYITVVPITSAPEAKATPMTFQILKSANNHFETDCVALIYQMTTLDPLLALKGRKGKLDDADYSMIRTKLREHFHL